MQVDEAELAEQVAKVIIPVIGTAEHGQVFTTCLEIVRRLLAGGISETAIRNTLVHYREPTR